MYDKDIGSTCGMLKKKGGNMVLRRKKYGFYSTDSGKANLVVIYGVFATTLQHAIIGYLGC